MDPNAALENILRGHMIADHAEALEGWLERGGFAPTIQPLTKSKYPLEVPIFVQGHCARHYPGIEHCKIHVRANRFGLWTSGPDPRTDKVTPWISLATFAELKRMSE